MGSKTGRLGARSTAAQGRPMEACARSTDGDASPSPTDSEIGIELEIRSSAPSSPHHSYKRSRRGLEWVAILSVRCCTRVGCCRCNCCNVHREGVARAWRG